MRELKNHLDTFKQRLHSAPGEGGNSCDSRR
jgi:hypothetical protein